MSNKKRATTSALRYVGTGFIADIPARDLNPAEVEWYATLVEGGFKALIASGLYEMVEGDSTGKVIHG